jgi:hypothetical protein
MSISKQKAHIQATMRKYKPKKGTLSLQEDLYNEFTSLIRVGYLFFLGGIINFNDDDAL